MMQRLFVYGSLAPGEVNHHVLAEVPGSWTKATMRGKLIDRGWAAGLGFPGVLVRDDGDEIAGLVFCSSQLSEHWPRLDAFEGEEYVRVPVVVKVEGDQPVEAFVYARCREKPLRGSRGR